MNIDFIIRCDDEIKTNTEKKGKWEEWKPSRKELAQELAWHVAKLHQRILNGDTQEMEEAAADVANICEKAFTMATCHRRVPVEDCYGDFCGYADDWRAE